MTARRTSFHLTPFASEFLQIRPAARVVVRQFDVWLKASCRPVRQLDASEIEQFLQRLATASAPESTRVRRRHLALRYFDWLRARISRYRRTRSVSSNH
jgi:hypothetical protein